MIVGAFCCDGRLTREVELHHRRRPYLRFPEKHPFGDELTLGYTCENSGAHAFPHTELDEQTEFPRTKVVTVSWYTTATIGYTWS
jgi:hypothetical protein